MIGWAASKKSKGAATRQMRTAKTIILAARAGPGMRDRPNHKSKQQERSKQMVIKDLQVEALSGSPFFLPRFRRKANLSQHVNGKITVN